MDSLTEILKIGGGVGTAIAVIILLAKSGLLQLKIGKNGNGKSNIDQILQNHEERLDIANKEMGDVKESLARIDERTVSMQGDIKETKIAINNIYKKLDE